MPVAGPEGVVGVVTVSAVFAVMVKTSSLVSDGSWSVMPQMRTRQFVDGVTAGTVQEWRPSLAVLATTLVQLTPLFSE